MRRNQLPRVLRYVLLAAALMYAAGAHPRVTGSAPKSAPGGGNPESASPEASAAEVTSVREISLTAKDLAVNPKSQTLYASIPADAPSGNSIAAIDPTTASFGAPVFIGSSPGKMAVSDDGQFVYIVLDGAGAVRRFDVATQTAGPQFTMGNDISDGPLLPLSLSVAPGLPHTYAVFRLAKAGGFTGNVAVFDDGVMRGATYPLPENAASVAFGADASRLYSYAALPRRLARLTASSSGLAVAATSQLSIPTTLDAIKFDAGRLYTGSGYVIDAEAGTVLGSFPPGGLHSTWPFAVDSKAGRAFYVTYASQTFTVRAFDLNTLQEVGSINLPAASTEEPTGLVRWGSNGLALSTTAGRVLIIQSTLVPSPDPVPTFTPTPTPTPSPSPTPFETFVRRISLPTKDIVYNSTTQRLYATLPSSAGANGNSVTSVDPSTGEVGPSVFIGSEPGRMSLTADGQYIYVALTGATAVRRFDVATQTAGPQFMLITNPSEGGDYATDLAPVPGRDGSVAVASRRVSVYDDGVRRPKEGVVGFGGGSVFFSDSPSRLYSTEPTSNGSTLYKQSVDETGVTTLETFRYLLGSGPFAYDRGRLYTSAFYSFARVFDPETGTLLGSFRLGDNSTPFGETCDYSSLVPDASTNRVFFLCSNFGTPTNGTVKIKAFDTQTFVPRGSISIAGVTGDIGRLVRWGKNGLAFRTATNQLFLIQSTLVSTEEPVPAPTPTPSPTPFPTPTPTPTPGPGELRAITLTAKDLVIAPNTQTLFASVPASAAAGGNSITPIDPAAATAGSPVNVGNDPGKMAVSDNGQYVYVVLNGDHAVRRFDVATRTAGPQFSLGTDPQYGPYGAEDIEVAPGQPGVVALALTRGGYGHAGVAIFDDGVQRPVTTPWTLRSNRIEFSASPSVLYGQTLESSGFEFRKLGVASCGVSGVNAKTHPYFSSDFQIANGLAYTIAGRVYNPEDLTLLGTFPDAIGVVAPDPQAGRFYVLQTSGGSFATLRVFDATTYLPLGVLRLPGVSGSATSLVRWGEHGLAFNAGAQVFILQNALIGGTGESPSGPAPAAPTYTASGNVIAAVGGTAEGVTLTVTGALMRSLTLGADGFYNLSDIQPCTVPFTITPSKPDYIFNPTSLTVTDLSSAANLQFIAVPKSVGFQRLTTNAFEGAGSVQLNVARFGDTSQPAAVSFETVPGTASDRSDFNTTLGTLRYAPGETLKTINVLLNDDAFAEGTETFSVVLKDPEGVMVNSFASTLTVNLIDNDASTTTSNPVDGTAFFVRQHYVDFLNREPDASGLAFWTNEIDGCGTDAQCREVKRINVSAAFFLSIEFQETGYLAYRARKAAYGNLPDKPVPGTRAEMLGDVQVLGAGLIVGAEGWQQKLEQNKQTYFDRLASSARFAALYPQAQTSEQYVDALNTNAGGALSRGERDALVSDLKGGAKTRAQALRAVAEDADLAAAERNRAFVLMQYFGYLRRDPDATPDADFTGWQFWLSKLEEFRGNYINAEMVKAFISSDEYRKRFGQ